MQIPALIPHPLFGTILLIPVTVVVILADVVGAFLLITVVLDDCDVVI